MEKLRDDHRFNTVDQALRFLAVRAGSQPEARELAEDVGRLRESLRAQNEAYLAAKDRRMAGTAVVNYLDGVTDAQVMQVSRLVLAQTNGDRADRRYRKLFPESASVLLAGVTDPKQQRFVSLLVDTLSTDPNYSALRPQAESLADASRRLVAAIEKRESLYQDETRTLSELNLGLEQARRVYNQAHPRLQLAFPDDPALVESFFLAL